MFLIPMLIIYFLCFVNNTINNDITRMNVISIKTMYTSTEFKILQEFLGDLDKPESICSDNYQ